MISNISHSVTEYRTIRVHARYHDEVSKKIPSSPLWWNILIATVENSEPYLIWVIVTIKIIRHFHVGCGRYVISGDKVRFTFYLKNVVKILREINDVRRELSAENGFYTFVLLIFFILIFEMKLKSKKKNNPEYSAFQKRKHSETFWKIRMKNYCYTDLITVAKWLKKNKKTKKKEKLILDFHNHVDNTSSRGLLKEKKIAFFFLPRYHLVHVE